MSRNTEKMEVEWWVHASILRWNSFVSRLTDSKSKLFITVAVIGLAAYAFALRSLHLLNPDQHYIISPDSYFFHWLADRVIAGEGPPSPPGVADIYTLHSGLAYPLAYIAKAVSSIFNMPSADALDLVAKVLPPLIGILSMVIIYLVATRCYGRLAGLLSAFAWAAMGQSLFIGGAGYLDRDGLSVLLLMGGAFLFYFSKGWRFRVGNRDLGWLVVGLFVLVIEALLYLEWNLLGPMILLAVLITYGVSRFLVEYSGLSKTEASAMSRLSISAKSVNWQAFAFIIGANAVMFILVYSQASYVFDTAIALVRSGDPRGIDEQKGLGLQDFITYQFLIIPAALGLYFALKKRTEAGIFFISWFLCLFVLSVFARRFLLYSAPAVSMLVGLGMLFLLSEWWKQGQHRSVKKASVAALIFLMVFTSMVAGFTMGAHPKVAVHEDWRDALTYLRNDTPEDAVIITWWDYGYWILDMGQRRPVVDNGYYGTNPQTLLDIQAAYLATETSQAVQSMKKHGADYLIFSELDNRVAEFIVAYPQRPKLIDGEYEIFPENSLITRSLDGEFERDEGLEVVYRSGPGSDIVVVILRLTQSAEP